MSLRPGIGLFYGSTTCYTEMAAERIARALAPTPVTLHNVADTPLAEMALYRFVIAGIPTWDFGELQEDWERAWDEWVELDLRGVRAALFGLGDQVGYPEWFLDGLGYLYRQITAQGAEVIGAWPIHGYEFESSQAVLEDGLHFAGLALDEENQSELSEARIEQWCSDLKRRWELPG